MTHPRLVVTATLASLALLAFGCAAKAGPWGDGMVRVMTQNMYQGTNFTELLNAMTEAEFLAAVTATMQDIQATKPAERAAALATEIAANRPDLVALQEVAILRTGSGITPATNVVSDQLELLLQALATRGQPYQTVAIVPNLDAEAPSTLGFDGRFTARTVIIARTIDVLKGITLSDVRVQEYLVNRVVTTPLGVSITDMRGWASVDVSVRGRMFRLVTTHLENTSPTPPQAAIQQAQAIELVQSAGNTALPVVFVGDFNVLADLPSDPSYATYQLLINSGLADGWLQKAAPAPGFTCCQDPSLLNPVSKLAHRIDLVLLRGGVGVRDIKLVGQMPSDRTPSGLWPSDHAGLVATLSIPSPPH